MKDELNYENPENVLRAFFKEMNRWEIESFPLIKAIPKGAANDEVSSVYQPIEEKLDAIFQKYCTAKERKQGRQNCIAAASPPGYDVERQTIIETIYENPRRATIDTIDKKGFDKKYRYVLLKKGGKWLIDNKKWFTFDGKLEKNYL